MVKKLGGYLVDLLRVRGIQYFFANPGTEFSSIIESFAANEISGQRLPQPVMVPHEAVAVNMAYGAYLATGKPQAVMVHATIGAANAAAALINASRMNIPMLFIAGRTPITETGYSASRDKFIHWAQESYDQGGMFREYMKWDYELRQSDHLATVLDRALSIMNTAPKGPVYLQLPRERLMDDIDMDDVPQPGTNRAALLGVPASSQLDQLVKLIANARHPIILTKTLGENAEAIKSLEEFADQYAIPVITPDAHYYNISSRHDMFCGYQRNHLYEQADLVLNLGMDVPWCPVTDEPTKAATVIHIAEDPLFQKIPIRTHRGDIFLIADITSTLQKLIEALMGQVNSLIIEERRREVMQFKKQLAVNNLSDDNDGSLLSTETVAQAINEIWDENCILVNELSLSPDPIQFDQPGCYFRTGSASGLGWGLGAAIGIALAAPQKTIIAVIGDGSYYFANPTVIHWLAKRYGLKVLTIILNNNGMKSIQGVTEKHFPDGAASNSANFPLTSLEPAPNFEDIAVAFDGYGYRVDKLKDLNLAIEEALHKVRQSGNQSLVNVILDT